MVYLLGLLIKILHKPPITILQRHKSAKTMLFDQTTLWKFLIAIIRFFWGKTDEIIGALLMLSSVVKFGQILPIGWDFGYFLLVSIEIYHEI